MKKSFIINQLGSFQGLRSLANNQQILRFEYGELFNSYESIICVRFFDCKSIKLRYKTVYGVDWNYSKTTAKYRRMFADLSADEVRQQIESGKAIYSEDLQ